MANPGAQLLVAIGDLVTQEKRIRLDGTANNLQYVKQQLVRHYNTLPNKPAGETFEDFLDPAVYPPTSADTRLTQIDPNAASNTNGH